MTLAFTMFLLLACPQFLVFVVLGNVDNLKEFKLVSDTIAEKYQKSVSANKIHQLNELVKEGQITADELEQELIAVTKSTLKFATPENTAVFWTGRNKLGAQAWARANGKNTLEQTEGGWLLEILDLFNKFGTYPPPSESPVSRAQAGNIWNIATHRFATEASGEVFLFSEGAPRLSERSGNLRTLYRLELPLLLENPRITLLWRMSEQGQKLQPPMSKMDACLRYLEEAGKFSCSEFLQKHSPKFENMAQRIRKFGQLSAFAAKKLHSNGIRNL